MKKQKILAVDDNTTLISSLREKCKDSDKIEIVFEAHDGDSAMDIIRNKKDEFDLILLDLIMPNKDGKYVLDKMREEKINKDIINKNFNINIIRRKHNF